MSPSEVAEMLKVTTQTVRLWMKKGKLPYIKVGGRYRIAQKDAEAMITPHNGAELI